MPQQKTIIVYKFSELGVKAKEFAKGEDQRILGYASADDAIASLKALAVHFNGTMKDWSVSWDRSSPSYTKFDMPEDFTVEDIRIRLDKLGDYDLETLKGIGDCKLTGYCADEDAIDGLRFAFYAGERDIDKLMQSAFRSWLTAAQDDYKDQYSDATFGENADANEYLYYRDGSMFAARDEAE